MANSSTDLLFLDRMTFCGILCYSSQGERSVPSCLKLLVGFFKLSRGSTATRPFTILKRRTSLATTHRCSSVVQPRSVNTSVTLARGSYLESTHWAAHPMHMYAAQYTCMQPNAHVCSPMHMYAAQCTCMQPNAHVCSPMHMTTVKKC